MENAAAPKLIKLLKDDCPQARQCAIKVIGEIDNNPAISYLESIARTDERRIQWNMC